MTAVDSPISRADVIAELHRHADSLDRFVREPSARDDVAIGRELTQRSHALGMLIRAGWTTIPQELRERFGLAALLPNGWSELTPERRDSLEIDPAAPAPDEADVGWVWSCVVGGMAGADNIGRLPRDAGDLEWWQVARDDAGRPCDADGQPLRLVPDGADRWVLAAPPAGRDDWRNSRGHRATALARLETWAAAARLIARAIERGLEPVDSERSVSPFCDGSTGAPPAADVDPLPTDQRQGPVHKPDGWTKSELVAQVKDGKTTFGDSTFDRIRIAAGVPAAEKGGKGQQRRYTRGELRRLIKAVKTGRFRSRELIAKQWDELLGT